VPLKAIKVTLLNSPLPEPTTSNTAAVIVSFHPDENFARRLTKLERQFTAVYWIDNTPGASVDSEKPRDSCVTHISPGRNVGLATALNLGCSAALDDDFKWVVTFDQDSDTADEFLRQQIAFWNDSDPSTFVLGCNYSEGGEIGTPRFKAGDYVVACTTVITSGCLMCLTAWDDLGGFRDDYFIDGLDHEICLRGRSNGLVVARHGRVLMKHRIGERSANIRIFPYLHTPVRKYYAMRNGVRNILEYALRQPLWAARKSVTLTWEILTALLFEPDRRRKLRAIFRGLRHGFSATMGPAPDDLIE
jgi:rhamnosyltransferase